MKLTREVLLLINKANKSLLEAKYLLIEAEKTAESIEEKVLVVAVQKRVQGGIKEILRSFFPETEFDMQAWLKRRRSADIEHDKRMQKILSDSANLKDMLDSAAKSIEEVAMEESDKHAEFQKIMFPNIKNKTCSHDCKDCDSREVAGDEEHCLQGEEMK